MVIFYFVHLFDSGSHAMDVTFYTYYLPKNFYNNYVKALYFSTNSMVSY